MSLKASLANKLLHYAVDSQKAPPVINLDLTDCMSSGGVLFSSQVLKSNSTISWFSLKKLDGIDETITVDHAAGLFYFVANNPSLKVLKLVCEENAPSAGASCQIGRGILTAASKNGNIEKVSVEGWACNYLSEISSSSSIKELEVKSIPTNAVEEWPMLPTTLAHLHLSPILKDRKNTCISTILKKLTKQGTAVQNLHIEGWSWSLPNFLRSCNFIHTLQLEDVDFQHDEETGCSVMDGLLLGLLAKTTRTLCFQRCKFDAESASKLRRELQAGNLSLKSLTFDHYESLPECIFRFWYCDTLQGLELISGGPREGDNVVLNSQLVTERLINGKISSLRIATHGLNSFRAPLKIATTKGTLTSLEVGWDVRFKDDIDCLVDLMKDKECKLQHLGLQVWNPIDSRLFEPLKQDHSNLRSLLLKISDQLSKIFDGLETSLPEFKSLQSLTLQPWYLTVSTETEQRLHKCVNNNWILESLTIRSGDVGTWETGYGGYPILTPACQTKLDKIMLRNKAKKAIEATPTNPSAEEKIELVNTLATYWGLPDGLSLAFWMLERVPACFF